MSVQERQCCIGSEASQICARCRIEIAVDQACPGPDSGILTAVKILRQGSDGLAKIDLPGCDYGVLVECDDIACNCRAPDPRTRYNNRPTLIRRYIFIGACTIGRLFLCIWFVCYHILGGNCLRCEGKRCSGQQG